MVKWKVIPSELEVRIWILCICVPCSGQLYGLEKFWAFLKYSQVKNQPIDPKLQEHLNKFKTVDDFRVVVSCLCIGNKKEKSAHCYCSPRWIVHNVTHVLSTKSVWGPNVVYNKCTKSEQQHGRYFFFSLGLFLIRHMFDWMCVHTLLTFLLSYLCSTECTEMACATDVL